MSGAPAHAQFYRRQGPPSRYQGTLDRLQAMTSVPVREWRTHADNLPHPEDPALDDSSWSLITLGSPFGRGPRIRLTRPPPAAPGWYRALVVIPATAGGKDVRGARVRLVPRLFGDGRVFFNGNLVAQGEGRLLDPILLTNNAVPGRKTLVAIGPFHSPTARFFGAQLLIDTPGQPDPGLLRDEILSTETLLAAFPANAQRREQLDRAVKAIDFAALDGGNQQAFTQSLSTATADLQPLHDWMRQYTVRAVGNSHIDMAWLWPWTETVEVVRDTFTTALQLMQEYPGFTYTQSSAQDFAWMQAKYPDLFRQIQDRVKDGHFEIVGGMWVEPDLNMPDGESLVRQLLVGKRYFQQNLGVDVKIGWNPDSFGYNWQLPQIYKKSGVNYFVTQKMSWNDTTVFPYKLFWWQSPDGSKLLTYFPNGYGNNMNPLGLARDIGAYAASTKFPELMYLYGVGDHGGGPTRTMLDQYLQLKKSSTVFPRIEFSTAQSFFDDVEKGLKQGSLTLPTWNNELYLEFHRGVYTTQSETKRRIRSNEELLQNSEKFASLALLNGRPYPQSQFEDCWKRLLFDDFHDVMPGSGIAVNYVDARRNLHVVSLQGHQILHAALHDLTAHVNTQGPGVPVVIYNSLSWARTAPVLVSVQFPTAARTVVARDSAGKPLLTQVVSLNPATHQARVRVLVRNIPPMGYAVIHLLPAPRPSALVSPLKATGTTLENQFLRVTVDPRSGCVTSLFNKADHRETLAPGASGNLLQAFADNPKQFDAWNIDADFEDHEWDLNRAESVTLIERGPVRAVIRVKKRFQNSTFVQDICLYADVPRVDVNMTADWHEKHILLKVAFPVSVQSPYATYEIPYGTIRRPTTRNTPAEKAMFEVPALRWGDLSDASHGFSLLNASKYGYDAKGNTIRLSLLRAPTYPDPHADEGFHRFTYALYPHAGNWQDGKSMQKAYELNFPLIPITTSTHAAPWPAVHSFVQIQPANVILTVVKKAEDDGALVFRFYEFQGKPSQVRLTLPQPAIKAVETNLMETEEHPLALIGNGRTLVIPTGPYAINTVKVWFATRPPDLAAAP